MLLFEPHRDYVSSMKWLGPSGSALLTGSYDGIVRQLDVETGVCARRQGGEEGVAPVAMLRAHAAEDGAHVHTCGGIRFTASALTRHAVAAASVQVCGALLVVCLMTLMSATGQLGTPPLMAPLCSWPHQQGSSA